MLLQEGIGDTIRVSLTPAPGGDRTEEVRRIAADSAVHANPQLYSASHSLPRLRTHHQHLLPGDGGADSVLPARTMPSWKGRYIGVEEMKVAVMGCIVNGPGESKHANLGISLPGTFEEPKAPVYVDGRLFTTLKGDKIVAEFRQILDDYVESHYAAKEEVTLKA